MEIQLTPQTTLVNVRHKFDPPAFSQEKTLKPVSYKSRGSLAKQYFSPSFMSFMEISLLDTKSYSRSGIRN